MRTAVEVPYISALQAEKQSFVFDEGEIPESVLKNAKLTKYLKTGTTIAGMVCSDGVILGTDTRSTEDHIVADHNCSKLHRLADNISAAGAGMAADLDQVTEIVAADLDLFRKQVGLMPRVQTCVARLVQKLFKYQGHIAAYLIVAGVDPSGKPSLWYIGADGYCQSSPYFSMGSGGFFAYSMLETKYRDGLTVEEGKNIVADAIEAGVRNDMGSGSSVDILVYKTTDPSHPTLTRGYRVIEKISENHIQAFPIVKGATVVLNERRRPIKPFYPNRH